VASGYKRPLYVAAHADARFLYVVEQRGMIKVLNRPNANSAWTKAGVFLDLRTIVGGPFVGRGLLGLAFHPGYATNGRLYVFYTRRSTNAELHGDIVIAEYRRSTDLRADAQTHRQVIVIPHPNEYHFGGWIGFGPDGYLYATTGDPPQFDYGRNINSRLGKLLRFDPTKTRQQAGFIPAGNPFVGQPGNDLILAYGMRNPWRASFDRQTGDLFVSDVGETQWEEVNRFSPSNEVSGAFLGWSECEGAHEYPQPQAGPAPCAANDAVEPWLEYGHETGRCSVTGGYVYRGAAHAGLVGRYFLGDYCTGEIWAVPAAGAAGQPLGQPLDTAMNLNSFGEDALGEIYVAAANGTIWRVAAD
jgi:glucose/arabinose dehydrogenase